MANEPLDVIEVHWIGVRCRASVYQTTGTAPFPTVSRQWRGQAMNLTDEQWTMVSQVIPEPLRRTDGRGRPWKPTRNVLYSYISGNSGHLYSIIVTNLSTSSICLISKMNSRFIA